MRRNSIHTVTVSDVRDNTGTLQTNANASCKVIVKGADGTTILAATAMTYTGVAGAWSYDVPATNFPDTNAPWTVIVEVYNLAGSTLRGTFTFVGEDQWWASS